MKSYRVDCLVHLNKSMTVQAESMDAAIRQVESIIEDLFNDDLDLTSVEAINAEQLD